MPVINYSPLALYPNSMDISKKQINKGEQIKNLLANKGMQSVPQYYNLSFMGKLSPEELEAIKLREIEAKETYKSLPLAFQFLCSNINGEVGHKKIQEIKKTIQEDPALCGLQKRLFENKQSSLREDEKDFTKLFADNSTKLAFFLSLDFEAEKIAAISDDQLKAYLINEAIINGKKNQTILGMGSMGCLEVANSIKEENIKNKVMAEIFDNLVNKDNLNMTLLSMGQHKSIINDEILKKIASLIDFDDSSEETGSVKLSLAMNLPQLPKGRTRDELISFLMKDNMSSTIIILEYQNIIDPELKYNLTQDIVKRAKEQKLEFDSKLASCPNEESKKELIQNYTYDLNITNLALADSLHLIEDDEFRNNAFKDISNSHKPAIRKQLIKSLIKLTEDQRELRNPIIRKFANDESEVRAELARNLLSIDSSELQQELVSKFNQDNDPKVKAALIEGLFKLPESKLSHKKELIKKFANDESEVRAELARNLHLIGTSEFQQELISKFKQDNDPNVKAALIEGLFKLPESTLNSKKELIKELANDETPAKSALARKLHLINDIDLRNELLKKFVGINEEAIQEGLCESVPLIPDLKLTLDIYTKIKDNSKLISNIYTKKGEQAFEGIKDPELPSILFFLGIFKTDKSDMEKFKQPFANYIKVFNEELSRNDESKLLSFKEISDSLVALYDNIDGKKLKKLVYDYNEFLKYALKFKKGFTFPNPEMSEDEIKKYFQDKAPLIIDALFLAGKPAIINVFNNKKAAFEDFLEKCPRILKDKDLLEPISKVCSLPSASGETQQYNKLLNYSLGLIDLKQKELLLQHLDECLKKGVIDAKPLEDSFVNYLSKDIGIPRDEFVNTFNMKYVHALASAWSILTPVYKNNLITLLTLNGKEEYYKFIHDPNTNHGKTNLNTRQIFKANGINYDKWVKKELIKSPEKSFSLKTGENLTIKLCDYNPGYDLFQGNYSNSCFALNAMNRTGIIDTFLNSSVQLAEIKNPEKTIGTIYMFWAKDKKTNELMCVIDAIDLARDYKNAKENNKNEESTTIIRNEVVEFVKSYTKEVAGRDIPVVLGSDLNVNLKDIADKKQENVEIDFIGDAVLHKETEDVKDKPVQEFYLNTWKGRQNVTKTQKVDFYRI